MEFRRKRTSCPRIGGWPWSHTSCYQVEGAPRSLDNIDPARLHCDIAAAKQPQVLRLRYAPLRMTDLSSLGCFHCMAEQQVGSGLITSPIAFQPSDYIVIQPDGDWTLCRTIEPANLRAAPIDNFGHLGKINRSVGLGGDGGDLPLLRGCELLHNSSFPGRMRFAQR